MTASRSRWSRDAHRSPWLGSNATHEEQDDEHDQDHSDDADAAVSIAVTVASNLAFVGAPSAGIYCASKGAVATFTKAIAAEVDPRGIRVNMVCPGPVETEFNREYREGGAQRDWELATPLRSAGSSILAAPARIAPAAVFLASDEARHITGAALLIDGGMNSV